MPDDRKYVRVFHADLIRDYPAVWDDDAALASWLRLLVLADGSWPAPAELPRSIKDRSLAMLVKAGLVTHEGPHRFRIKGMDADRNARRDAGRNAAALRWHSEGNADRIAKPMPTRAEQSNTEQSSTARENDPYSDEEGEALTWLAKHGCDVRPGNGYHRQLVTAVQAHGINAVIGMFDRLASGGMHTGDTKGYVFGMVDALNGQSRPDLKVVAAEDREAERRSAQAKRLAATQVRLHENGAHFDTKSAACPRCKEVPV